MRLTRLVPVLLLAGLAACEKKTFDAPDEASRIELADSLYSPALFDSVAWPDAEQRVIAGNLVYADNCRRCHGSVGEGGVASVAGREVHVPSLVQADWPLDDEEDIRQRIFTGHTGGMPSWGISRLTPREIDAVAYYIIEQLRPELLSERAP